MVILRLMAASDCGMMRRPDCDRRIAQADLVEQRQQERHAADAEARDEAPGHRGAEGPDAEEAEPQQRVGGGIACQP